MICFVGMKSKTTLFSTNMEVTPKCSIKKSTEGAGDMAQWLRALAALPEVLSSIPSNYMVAHSHL